jgi:galactose mutarotase-like enzyme
MSFSHREERRGDRLLDVLTDESSGVRLIVSRIGAELVSLAHRNSAGDWVGFLYRDNDLSAPAKGWANHATVMGYFLHRLKDGRSLYRGKEIKGGTHSFLRAKTWHLAEAKADKGEVIYRITPEDFTASEYPLRVRLDLSYRVERDSVRVTFHFHNDEPELTAHVAFGLHPGFGATSYSSFQFRMPPGKYRRHLAPGNYLSGETEDIDFGGGEMPFSREQLPGSYILELRDVPPREFVYFDPPTGREVTMDLRGVPYLTLWSDGGPFLCVEPCWGLTDHDDQRAFEDKEGMQIIAPGGELTAGFALRLQLAAAK